MPPDKPVPLRKSHSERTDISDSRMLHAAIQLIISKGTQKTTLKEVGELAEYSRGLAGYRFGSKSGLFQYVLLTLGELWLQKLNSASEDKRGFEAIVAATDAHYRMCASNPDNVLAFYTLWFDAIGSDSDEFRQTVLNISGRRHNDLVTWVLQNPKTEGCSERAEAIAGHFSATLNGIVYQWLMRPDDLPTIKTLHDNLVQTMHLLMHS